MAYFLEEICKFPLYVYRRTREDSSEEMYANLPPLKWSTETFNIMVQNFEFPDSWGVRYPDEGQTTADAPAGYITLFWDYFAEGNFRLPVTKFFL
ncbi:hypothetical protein Hanom_Chr13g01205081 [Helianthus anomalus]